MATKQYAVIQKPKQNYKMALCQLWHQLKGQQAHSLKSDCIIMQSQVLACQITVALLHASHQQEEREEKGRSQFFNQLKKVKNQKQRKEN